MKKAVLTLAVVTTLMLSGCAQNATSDESVLSPGIPMPTQQPITTTQSTTIPNTTIRLTEQTTGNVKEINPYRKVSEDIYTNTTYEEYPEVIRYGRYTLVTSAPIGGQKYLLEQLVDVNVPVKKKQYTRQYVKGCKPL